MAGSFLLRVQMESTVAAAGVWLVQEQTAQTMDGR
jgi:hypothetical protein